MTDLTVLSIDELSQGLQQQEFSATELFDAFMARIRKYDKGFDVFTEIYAESAKEAAYAADLLTRSGHRVSPLQGIPIAIKDLIEISGRITTGGCAAWRQRVSTKTAPLVHRLVASGVIMLGKTKTVEFAMGGWGTNTHMGMPRNPWDLQSIRVPGGSSSGSGVAVALSFIPWSVGTDTGGSIRLPASYCGLTALKVTPGRISTAGILPLSPTLDTPGPIARSVRDVTLLYHILSSGCRTQAGERRDCAKVGNGANALRGYRIASLHESELTGVSNSVLAAYHESLKVLADLGAEVIPMKLPFTFAETMEMNGMIQSAESYAGLAEVVEDKSLPLDENVRERVLKGKGISAYQYLSILKRRDEMKAETLAALRGFDCLATPTTKTTAPLLSNIDEHTTPAHFTRAVNLLELCAVVIPNGRDAQGLPTSLQLIGKPFAEEQLLAAAQACQDSTKWHLLHPPGFY
ncbi:Aspartyl-tRNA(Asn)/glutamyl-tRNA(Gln) amidotransferase subunit A OS=Castellaniella defragrans OX=75697 GN=HNR28_001829 PE=4 SV=1 [Castellaniella defragrans]